MNFIELQIFNFTLEKKHVKLPGSSAKQQQTAAI